MTKLKTPKQLEAYLTAKTEKDVQRLVERLFLSITGATPVNTGWAQTNWTATLGAPPRVNRPRPTNYAGGRSVADVNYAAAVAAGRVTYVSNYVPYIIELNEGSSRKAPAHFVQQMIAKAVSVD